MLGRGRRRALVRGSAGLLALALAACSPGPAPEALEVLHWGCENKGPAGECGVFADAELTLWAAAPPAELEVVSGGMVVGTVESVDGGSRLKLDLEGDDGIVVLEARGAEGRRAAWSLRYVPDGRPTWYAEIVDAERYSELRAAAEQVLTGTPSPLDRAFAYSALARLSTAQERAALRHEELARRAFELHLERGDNLWAVHDGAYLLWNLGQRGDRAAAREILDRLPEAHQTGSGLHLIAVHRTAQHEAVGDLRSALGVARGHLQAMSRLGLAGEQARAGQTVARLLHELGRYDESLAVLDDLMATAGDLEERRRAALFSEVAWARLLAREAGLPAQDPTPLLAQALELLEAAARAPDLSEAQRRGREVSIVNAAFNLALAHLQNGELEEGRPLLSQVRASLDRTPRDHRPVLHTWTLDLEARVALAGGEAARAEADYRRLGRMAEAAASPEAQWRAAIGLGRSLAAAGRIRDALGAYAAAEELLDGWSLRAPIHQGRGLFLAQRERGTREYLDLLLAAGRPAAALRVARRSLARVPAALAASARLLRLSPEERARWDRAALDLLAERERLEAEVWRLYRELTGSELDAALGELAARRRELMGSWDELAATLAEEDHPDGRGLADRWGPSPGELLLVLHPTVDGWVALAAAGDGGSVEVARISTGISPGVSPGISPRGGPAAATAAVAAGLAPLASTLAGAGRAVLEVHAGLADVDLHSLPLAGVPWIEGTEVVYGTGLGPAGEIDDTAPQALIVADPTGDLPATRQEAIAVRAALAADPRGWLLTHLTGREAGGPAVRRELTRARLFHYAGHAVRGGVGGWDSALPLSPPTLLTVGDILAQPASPAWVVLSGCETGGSAVRAERLAPASAMSLAQAFLVAGSREVVASMRPVADREAAALLANLYRHWTGTRGLGEALRRAQNDLRSDLPEADWAAFRAFVP